MHAVQCKEGPVHVYDVSIRETVSANATVLAFFTKRGQRHPNVGCARSDGRYFVYPNYDLVVPRTLLHDRTRCGVTDAVAFVVSFKTTVFTACHGVTAFYLTQDHRRLAWFDCDARIKELVVHPGHYRLELWLEGPPCLHTPTRFTHGRWAGVWYSTAGTIALTDGLQPTNALTA